EREVATLLSREMRRLGFDNSLVDDADNAVGLVGEGPRQLVFLGHIDTVAGEVPVRFEDGKLYGRGTVDAKGPLCAFIVALSEWMAERRARGLSGVPEGWRVVVIGASGEESPYAKGARYVITQYTPDLLIIGEPSGSDGITTGYKGRLLMEAHLEQSSQHTARPGPNPSEYAVKLWNALHTFADLYNGEKQRAFDLLMPKLRDIRSGDDGMREWCDVYIGFRLPMEITPGQLQKRITDEFETLKAASTLDKTLSTLSFRGNEPAVRSDRHSPLARAFVDAIRGEKVRPIFYDKTGTSDWNVVSPYWKCPTVAYGPGDSALDHTPIEHVEVAEFERGVRVLKRVLDGILAGGQQP
ncbi:MAG: [LysW]-lysine hydrolase, partial [Thermoflexales bacterium]|nr:[LysW]-lysine hydrolase [Thermoflexales bacterium]